MSLAGQPPQRVPVGAWYSSITFPDAAVERSIIMYGRGGSVTESSTRYPTRLAGIGQWRSVEDGRFEGFFEKFAFAVEQQKPTALVRVEFTAILNDTATEYTGDARGVFMTMDREVRNAIPTTVVARRLPWTL